MSTELDTRLAAIAAAVGKVADHLAAQSVRISDLEKTVADLREEVAELKGRVPTPGQLAALDAILAQLQAMVPA
jgi:uncharacterized protein YceH (UPF0502 family)